jgi:hypothetical protein
MTMGKLASRVWWRGGDDKKDFKLLEVWGTPNKVSVKCRVDLV